MEQLNALQKSIESKLKSRAEGVDIGYWESLLSQLKAHSARGRLSDKHKENLRNKLAQLKAEQLETHAGGIQCRATKVSSVIYNLPVTLGFTNLGLVYCLPLPLNSP